MRQRFNLDIASLERFAMLLHGNYGVGKTFLLGDMLRYEAQSGKTRFLNVAGEDGALSIANLGLGEIAETVDTLPDFKAALAEYKKDGVHALAVDGGKFYGKLIIRAVCGDRLPSVGKGSDDWAKIHREFEDTLVALKQAAPVVVMASSSDRSMDQITGETSLTPDFPGRQAAGSGGQFDFVFLVKAQALTPTKVRRWVETAPTANTVIRQRLPKPLPPVIELPENGGGWAIIRKAMQECLAKGGK